MNMNNSFSLMGKVVTKPVLQQGEKTVYTHLQLATNVANKPSVFEIVAYGDTAKKLAHVQENSILLTNLFVQEKKCLDRSTGQSVWKTNLIVTDFNELIAQDVVKNTRADELLSEVEQKKQTQINDVIFNTFL